MPIKPISDRFSTENIAFWGLWAILTFSVFTKGAHDFWAASLVTLVSFFLVLVVLYRAAFDPAEPGIPAPLVLPIALIIIAFWVSTRSAVNPREAFYEAMDWTAAGLLFYLALIAFRRETKVVRFLGWMFPALLFQLILCINDQFVLKANIYLRTSHGALINASFTAAFVLLWFIPLLAVFLKTPKENKRAYQFWFVCLLLCVGVQFLTKSVVVWLAMGLALLILLGKERVKKFYQTNRRTAFVLLAISVAAILISLYFKWVQIFGGPEVLVIAQDTSRLMWWMSGIGMFLDYPWTGVGAGCFPSAFLAYKAGPGLNTLYPHGFLVGLLSETGIVGAGAFVFLCVMVWKTLLRNKEQIRARQPYLLAFVLYVAVATVSLNLELLSNLLSGFLVLGLVLAAGNHFIWKPRKSVFIVACAGFLAVIPFIFSPFVASQNLVSGENNVRQDDLMQAKKDFKTAVALDPFSWRAYQNLALLAEKEENFKEASEKMKRAIQGNQLNGELHWKLGIYYHRLEQKEKALEYLNNAKRMLKRNEYHQEGIQRWINIANGKPPL